MAERVPFSLPAQPIGDILCQKWYACFTKIPFARHSNIIAVDLGKEGVLERLVNSVRVSPTKPGLDALIKYIFLLEGKFPIEERFYYTKLYKKLFHKRHFLAAANPLRVYTLAKRILALFGAGFFLRRPQLIAWSVQMLRAVGINPAGIYHFLKKHLFNETDKTPSSEGPGTFQIKSD